MEISIITTKAFIKCGCVSPKRLRNISVSPILKFSLLSLSEVSFVMGRILCCPQLNLVQRHTVEWKFDDE